MRRCKYFLALRGACLTISEIPITRDLVCHSYFDVEFITKEFIVKVGSLEIERFPWSHLVSSF